MFSTAARAAPGVDHPRHPVVRGEGDADDLPPSLRDEGLRRDRVGHVPGALDVELGDRAEALRRDRLGRGEELAAGVVDEHVDPAVALEQRRRPCSPTASSSRMSAATRVEAAAVRLDRLARLLAAARAGGRSRRPWRRGASAPARSRGRSRCRPRKRGRRCPSSRPGAKIREGWAGTGQPMRALVRRRAPTRGRGPCAGSLSRDEQAEGRGEAARASRSRRGAKTGATVVVEPLLGGEMQAPPAVAREPRAAGSRRRAMLGIGTPRSKWPWLPVPAFLITHPTAGPLLVDTAFHASVAAKPVRQPRPARWRASPGRGSSPAATSRRSCASAASTPASSALVVMTHMHFDHTSGIAEYPQRHLRRLRSASGRRRRPTTGRSCAATCRATSTTCSTTGRSTSTGPGSPPTRASGARSTCSATAASGSPSRPATRPGHCSVIAAPARPRPRDRRRRDLHATPSSRAGDPPPRPVDLHNWRRSLRELQQFAAHLPAGGDRARPRPRALARRWRSATSSSGVCERLGRRAPA